MAQKKIVIVDDDSRITGHLKPLIEDERGDQVTVINDSRKAVEMIKSIRPDFIFLDIEMPQVTGADIAFEIREDSSLRDIPVVFLTGMATGEDVAESGMISGHPFLAKPVTSEKILNCLTKYLD